MSGTRFLRENKAEKSTLWRIRPQSVNCIWRVYLAMRENSFVSYFWVPFNFKFATFEWKLYVLSENCIQNRRGWIIISNKIVFIRDNAVCNFFHDFRYNITVYTNFSRNICNLHKNYINYTILYRQLRPWFNVNYFQMFC